MLVNPTACRKFLSAVLPLLVVTLTFGSFRSASAADADYDTVVAKGVKFLSSNQADDGSYSSQVGIGPTAIATLALLEHGRSPNDPQVAKSLAYLEKAVHDDGGVYAANGRLKNYETCIALMCFNKANTDGKYDTIVKNAEKYVRGVQITDTDGVGEEDVNYGGSGYSGKTRPDLSNTAFLMDALVSSGADKEDEAIQKALVFVSRCQNLESEYNTTKFAGKVNDGGFYYTPAVSGDQGDRGTPDGGLRSYGSMGYAGLKSMIYAGVDKDDPRVKAVLKYIQKNFDVTANPGMGQAGVFYYYQTFAKSLDALGQPTITDASGVTHDWRKELLAELAKRQKEDGSWSNSNTQWLEGDANLATSFALLALADCQEKK
ncbi:terpene cyclase/mutase family protein [Blastopirellula sp. J2-11]|uniref:prenyltransferase/squalene oxidase repeat-containing protein n=1 Tax=Blastopirellula sp. J2-11 TaxID=2943192 RepID=UPI0021CA9CFE|nr:prenyltransferase/squalene oxidase repeat-containing protein [Blastopirellula sp. J2-11]UUO07156.1 terpene cyclase/mutase family protein [Blastopirellula sp. J2-11]